MRLWNGCLGMRYLPSCFPTKVSSGWNYKAPGLKAVLLGPWVSFQLISSTEDTISISQEGCGGRNGAYTQQTSCLPFAQPDWTLFITVGIIASICLAFINVYINFSLFFNLFCPQVVSDAAGQGVTITGSKTFNNWNWPNAVIFAATVITTIGKYFVEV